MSVGRISADDALQWLVDTIEECPLTTGDTRIGFSPMEFNDEDGSLPAHEEREFGFYVTSQGPSPWCFGGEAIQLTVRIAYQALINHQDIVELKNHLEYKAVTKAGVAGVYTYPTYVLNNDTGGNNIYVEMPLAIDYKPLKSQGE